MSGAEIANLNHQSELILRVLISSSQGSILNVSPKFLVIKIFNNSRKPL